MVRQNISDDTFRQLRDFIYGKSGIYISDTKKYLLENRLYKRLQERRLNSYEDYLYLIKYSHDGDELKRLFDVVTTNETYFFREPLQFEVLTREIIPPLLRNGSGNVKIWSAACSTGEEPYTIAMLLKETPEMKGLRTEIVASDISEGVLASARKGVYSSYSVRNVPERYLKKYFTNSDDLYTLDPGIKSMVRFMNVNLVDDGHVRTLRNFDVVFCRNVLIYFDDSAKKKAVSNIYDALKPGGHLFVGTSESLHNVTRAFRPVVFNKTLVYKRV